MHTFLKQNIFKNRMSIFIEINKILEINLGVSKVILVLKMKLRSMLIENLLITQQIIFQENKLAGE